MGKKPAARQPSPMWVTTADLPTSAGHPFFERLNRVLEEAGFDAFVEGLCAVFYASRLGRPSLRPGRYFRLLFIGYFEGLSSERGIAWRVADSLSLRAFLDLDVTEAPPNHSTLSRTRRLIDVETHVAVFTWVLERLAGAGLVQGKTVGVDATTLEANAAMRTLTWSRWFGQLEGLVKVYSDCEITPSSSSAPALTGGCHGWHEAGSYPVIDDDDALWNCGNLAAGAQAWAAALAREISNGLWAPASPPSGFSATVSGRPQAGQVHIAGWDMVLGPLMR